MSETGHEKLLEEISVFMQMELYRHLESLRSVRRDALINQLVEVGLASIDLRVRAYAHHIRWAETIWAEFDTLIAEAKDATMAPPEMERSEYQYVTP